MKIILVALIVSSLVIPGYAFDTKLNPDRYPSIGLDLSQGKLPGILKDTQATGSLFASVAGTQAPHTDGGFVKGALDIRLPLTNILTIHAFGSATGMNNNLQYSEGSEVGIGLRVYLHD